MMDIFTYIKIMNINLILANVDRKKSLCNHSEGFLNKMSPRFKLFESFVVNL